MLTRMSRVVGFNGNYLAFCRKIRRVPFPVRVPIFGTVGTLPEVLNLHDNFAAGELRDERTEEFLRAEQSPIIIDCGINVGITVRWWLHINPRATVFGFDMIQEAHDFTIPRLRGREKAYFPFTAALSANDGEEIRIHFDDPLNGENRVGDARPHAHSRLVPTKTIDSLLRPHRLTSISLLKMDIEGYGHLALRGASESLRVTQHVVIESHSEEELSESNSLLVSHGFRLRRFRNRNLWYERA